MKNFSDWSLSISLIIIIIKAAFEINAFVSFSKMFSKMEGDISPTVTAGGTKIILLILIIPLLISLLLNILGFIKNNKKRFLALALWLLALILVFIPFGLMLSAFSI